MSRTAKLEDLNPIWMFPADPVNAAGDRPANGIVFDCPACACGHKIRVRFDNHPTAEQKWTFKGNSFKDATIMPSIDGTKDKVCSFHGFVTDGVVTF